ncbi:MAG: orotidine 5'-phosphate decarboxylase [Halothiobacillus sp. 14-56-357]|jgi:orotidine-5'-phosphate decarboxylase|uniref:orotidine-5'-phosphate decarboxylase n=1 Tax=Halothiobacillus sp. 15-55-196 TaxID=1970382 RepID=UPI000BD80EC6|nr:orotidine-5'-phosphate decarboxylase [Halothiobacillus sp. 15-55-196]OZB37470.1 MAG: orotidine 5'-phosphate decarboxylase [Halothiobacillus sp. 15-55-196]OZB56256.1 MAG: orotidine 5'-phosphate decarboxylase [Halothiobacillus sp. 14-56-357]OZB78670.1 MAG: orotidine 5'-phosphate decarboxylase [Halothiobacillus sp. 13-55-115]
MSETVLQPRLYVALDFADPRLVDPFVDRLNPGDCGLKVGKELFTRGGPDLVRRLVHQGFPVFLDLKFHDIPHTVEQACKAACDLGVRLVNVHAMGGRAMMAAARRAVPQSADSTALIAVTVLTSMDQSTLVEVGITRPLAEQVSMLASLAQQEGLDGVVCSAWEANRMREIFTQPVPAIVTPGIRPTGTALDDQSRVMTPSEAILAGATSIVVGRPITRAPDPAEVVSDILASMSSSD